MGKKLGRKIAACIVVLTCAQLAVLGHYNNILNAPQTSAGEVKTNPSAPKTIDVDQKVADLSRQYSLVTLSDDNQFVAYMDSNQGLHVKNLASNQVVSQVQMKAPVVYLKWIRNDSLFIGEKFSVGGDHHLTLATVDIQTPEPRVIKSFTGMGATVTFKKIAFSPITNDVYVLIGSKNSSLLYYFDTNGTPSVLYLSGRLIQNVDVGQTNGVMFFQDYAEGTKNVLTYESHQVSLVQRNSVLLGVVGNDVYYGTLDSSGLVTEVYDYPTSSASTATSSSTNTLGSGMTTTPDNGPPKLVQTLTTPVDASHIKITSDRKVVITPS
jgi:hypothetical protein